MLVLDPGGVSRLAERSRQAAALIQALREDGFWPPRVLSVVLVECLAGHAGRDANANRLLKTCDIAEDVSDDPRDLQALATQAEDVGIVRV